MFSSPGPAFTSDNRTSGVATSHLFVQVWCGDHGTDDRDSWQTDFWPSLVGVDVAGTLRLNGFKTCLSAQLGRGSRRGHPDALPLAAIIPVPVQPTRVISIY